MPEDWRHDLPVHSFFALLAHVRIFGRGFLGQTLNAAGAITARADALRR
jgi:fructosamine-3-kinase